MKLVPYKSLDAVSYSPSIVTMAISVAVCEIFSVKEWRHLENQVRGRSRSLKMAPFDRLSTTFYWSAIVNIALSCTIFELFEVEYIHTYIHTKFCIARCVDSTEYMSNQRRRRQSLGGHLLASKVISFQVALKAVQ